MSNLLGQLRSTSRLLPIFEGENVLFVGVKKKRETELITRFLVSFHV